MAKRNFLILLLLVSFYLNSQTSTTTKKEVQYYPFPLSVLYGTKILQNSYFNSQLNSYNKFKFDRPINFVGLCLSAPVSTPRGYGYEPHLYYSQILPVSISINDSVKTNLGGFQVGVGLLGGNILRRQKNICLSIMLGANAGRIKLSNDKNVSQSNTFFSPKVTLKPTVYFWRLTFGALVDYEYDISKGAWKNDRNTGGEQIQLNKLSQTGITAQLNLGYRFKYISAKDKKIAKNKKKRKKKK